MHRSLRGKQNLFQDGINKQREVTESKMMAVDTMAELAESGRTSLSLSVLVCGMGEYGHCDTAPQGHPGAGVILFKG